MSRLRWLPVLRRVRWRGLIHRRLLIRLTLPALIGLVLLGFAVAEFVRGQVPAGVLLWLLLGVVIGYPFGHYTRLAWENEPAQLVQDGSGFLLLAGYIAVRVGEQVLLTPEHVNLPYIRNGAALIGVGLLIGRSLGLAGRIRRELLEQADSGGQLGNDSGLSVEDHLSEAERTPSV